MKDFIKKIDLNIINKVNKKRHVIFDKIMMFITRLGDLGLIWILTAVLLLLSKYKHYGIELLISIVIGAIICNLIIKPFFKRKRPYDKYETLQKYIKMKDYSFPSGHTCASFSSVVILCQTSLILSIPCLILASLIAYSRIHLNVHFFSDVICGALLGTIVSLIVIML